MFGDETFDAVLCLGAPLCHLLKEQRRKKAVSELVRVAKVAAPIIASVIYQKGTYFHPEISISGIFTLSYIMSMIFSMMLIQIR